MGLLCKHVDIHISKCKAAQTLSSLASDGRAVNVSFGCQELLVPANFNKTS